MNFGPATVERMEPYEFAAFIRNARSVCSDPVVEQTCSTICLRTRSDRIFSQEIGVRWSEFVEFVDGAGAEVRTRDVQLGKLVRRPTQKVGHVRVFQRREGLPAFRQFSAFH